MCLSLNPLQQEYLASGSEDQTVRIWDLDDLQCKAWYPNLHTDKVQAVRWNPVNDQILLTAGYDRKINIVDVKAAGAALSTIIPKSVEDIEQAVWHPRVEHSFALCTEGGFVLGYDTRRLEAPVFKLQAHTRPVSGLSFSPHFPNMMATSSLDGTVKVWDIQANEGAKPEVVGSRHMKQGDLYSMSFSNDIPWVMASGGNKGEVAVWDCSENVDIENHFKSFLIEGSYDAKDYDPNAVIAEEDDDEEFESMSDEESKKKENRKNRRKDKQKEKKIKA